MAHFEDSGGHTTGKFYNRQFKILFDFRWNELWPTVRHNFRLERRRQTFILVLIISAILVRNVYELLENSDPGTKCVDLEDDDNTENDGEYTPVFQCRSRCRTSLIRVISSVNGILMLFLLKDICHCTPISTEYLVEDQSELENYPICDYSKCKLSYVTLNLTINFRYFSNETEKLHEKHCVEHCWPVLNNVYFNY
jgi:hypothetical protein